MVALYSMLTCVVAVSSDLQLKIQISVLLMRRGARPHAQNFFLFPEGSATRNRSINACWLGGNVVNALKFGGGVMLAASLGGHAVRVNMM